MSQRRKTQDIGLIKHQPTLHTLRGRSIVDESPERGSKSPKTGRRASPKKNTGVRKRSPRRNKTEILPTGDDQFSSQDLSSDGGAKRKSGVSPPKVSRGRPRGSRNQDNGGFLDSLRRTFTPSAKSSVMKNELKNLNLSASKEYAFLYDEGRRSRQENRAMHDVDKYWLRDGTGGEKARRPSRRSGRRHATDDSDCCGIDCGALREFSNSLGIVPLVAVLLLILFYWLVVRATPYCDNLKNIYNAPRCSEGGWYWPWDCRACPANAHCSNGQLECLPGYKDVGGEICMSQSDNPWLAKLVSFLQEVDEGTKWNKNFRHYGAKNAQTITAEEIFAQIGANTELDQVNAGAALFTVFKQRKEDQYCMVDRFAARNLDGYQDWSEIQIASLKLGWPAAPEGGAKKHN